MNIAVILAGGVGKRVGAGIPKQFVEVLGKPLLAYTLEAFQEHAEIDGIEVVCVASHIPLLESMAKTYHFSKVRWIVPGGSDFQHSARNGIRGLQGKIDGDDIVAVHYGACPFVTADIISDGIRVCKLHGNSASAAPCYQLYGWKRDTASSSEGIDRSAIVELDSPQCFRYRYIAWIYEEAERRGLLDDTERYSHITSLLYALGQTIYFSKGSQANLKITEQEDLRLFEGYALLKRMGKSSMQDRR